MVLLPFDGVECSSLEHSTPSNGCEIRPNPALQIHNVIENMSREYYLGFCEILSGSFEIMPHSELCHFLDHPIYDIGMH